jgi:hypothetical protein
MAVESECDAARLNPNHVPVGQKLKANVSVEQNRPLHRHFQRVTDTKRMLYAQKCSRTAEVYRLAHARKDSESSIAELVSGNLNQRISVFLASLDHFATQAARRFQRPHEVGNRAIKIP